MLGLGKKKDAASQRPQQPPVSAPPVGSSFGQSQPPIMPTPPEAEPRLGDMEQQSSIPIQIPSSISPPLFVKIDKYTDIQTQLGELRAYSNTMRRTIDKLAESHKKLHMSLTMTYNTLDRIDNSIRNLENKFSNRVMKTPASHDPADTRTFPVHHASDAELETYLKDINKQVSKIKTELNSVR